ncbi:MAG: PLDc N-terminal domain-containing protein [Actinobacteria bacterium]|jgi:hypothetical protein|nr:PLDc N-terminal domain-containing protein [Actinomycetota bacterium]MBU1609862.1 PLDc N-terminal domain-containing protein [Actinomycetota bacterium]MBU2315959.1 PLDc N-terminal domain-containing protein [Actinomycetota bacterium]MBU2385161.1 PLDc N-terminal domain-containing protein [Actinomycetota bacterium]
MDSNLAGLAPAIIIIPIVVALAALWIGALVSIFHRSSAMSGLELIGWCALVVFAQFFGPLIWFFIGRSRYE